MTHCFSVTTATARGEFDKSFHFNPHADLDFVGLLHKKLIDDWLLFYVIIFVIVLHSNI